MNKISLLTVAFVFATALTLSCSDGNGNVSSSSDDASSEGGGSSSSVFTVSSSSGNGQSEAKITKSKITGVSQKGPFVKGSRATLYELNESFAQTGRQFFDIIADDKGTFEIKNVELISPYAMLEADGFYRNEVTGKKSAAPIKLYAIADIREKDNVNVNLLTHLEYYRVLNLAEQGKSIAEAKKQAQKEILAVFGINSDGFKNSEDISIFGTSEGDAALLAISVLLQGDLKEADFSERLTDFALSLKESGKWDSEAAKSAIADWASSANLTSIRNNIVGWGLSSDVPDFGKYVTAYWTEGYGIGGCDSKNEGTIKKSNVSNKEYVCKYGIWQEGPSYKDKYCLENECKYFIDSRDNKRYVYVVIGEQIWMAENLNYDPGTGTSVCYDNQASYCSTYGRLYDWETAMTVCFDGWHLPNPDEWSTLVNYAGGQYPAGIKLKAKSGWNKNGNMNDNGTDDYGFASLPGGRGDLNLHFYEVGSYGNWWSTNVVGNQAGGLYMGNSMGNNEAHRNLSDKNSLFSVRCLQNSDRNVPSSSSLARSSSSSVPTL